MPANRRTAPIASTRTITLASASARRTSSWRDSSLRLLAPARESRRTCSSPSRLAESVVALSRASSSPSARTASRRTAGAAERTAPRRSRAIPSVERPPVNRRASTSEYIPWTMPRLGMSEVCARIARSAARAALLSANGRRPRASANASITNPARSRARAATSASWAASTPSWLLSAGTAARRTRCSPWAMAFAASARMAGTASLSKGSSRRARSERCNLPTPRTATLRSKVSSLRSPSRSGATPDAPVPRASSATRIRCSVTAVFSVGRCACTVAAGHTRPMSPAIVTAQRFTGCTHPPGQSRDDQAPGAARSIR